MQKNNYYRASQKITHIVLDNGLNVYFMPSKKRKIYHMSLGIRYGSADTYFIPKGEKEYISVPKGTAHFLEHKLFDIEEGTDPFVFFSESGSITNAGTNYNYTRYYVDGTKDLLKNLDYFLKMLFNFQVSEESIQKEMGIIEEEIEMYDDEVNCTIDDYVRKCMFSNLDYKEKIAGTHTTIHEITKDILEKCYRTFYIPSNMCFLLSGNFDSSKVLEVLKNHPSIPKIKEELPKVLRDDEPNEILPYERFLPLNISIPELCYTLKIKRPTIIPSYKVDFYLNCFFTLLIGNTSTFEEEILKNNLAFDYYFEHLALPEFYIWKFNADTLNAKKLESFLECKLNIEEINKEDFNALKKGWIASEIRVCEKIEFLGDSLFDDIIIYNNDHINRLTILEEDNYDEFCEVINNIDFSNKVVIEGIIKE